MSSDPIEVLRLAAENAATAIRNCVNAGQIGEGYRQYADDVDAALASLSAPNPESAEAVGELIEDGAETEEGDHYLHQFVAPRKLPEGTKVYTAPPRPEASAPVGVDISEAVSAFWSAHTSCPPGSAHAQIKAGVTAVLALAQKTEPDYLCAGCMAEAWQEVCALLSELRPGWAVGRGTGQELALATIRRGLSTAPQQASAPAPVAGEDADGWQHLAADWLEQQAEEQEATNAEYPRHAAAYPEWRDRPVFLRTLAEKVKKAEGSIKRHCPPPSWMFPNEQTEPTSAPVGVETVDAAAWIEVLELPEGFRVAEHLPGIWEYQFDIEDEADEDSDRKVSGASWNHPALAAMAAWGHAYDAVSQQPAPVAPVGVEGLPGEIRNLASEFTDEGGATEVMLEWADRLERALAQQPAPVAPTGAVPMTADDPRNPYSEPPIAQAWANGYNAAHAQQPAADEEAAEQFRKGWQAGFAEGRRDQQPAAVDGAVGRAFLAVLADPNTAWRDTGAKPFIDAVSVLAGKQQGGEA